MKISRFTEIVTLQNGTSEQTKKKLTREVVISQLLYSISSTTQIVETLVTITGTGESCNMHSQLKFVAQQIELRAFNYQESTFIAST